MSRRTCSGNRSAADKLLLYRVTDPGDLMVKPGRDCHLTLLNTGPTGTVAAAYSPNRYQQQTLIRAGLEG